MGPIDTSIVMALDAGVTMAAAVDEKLADALVPGFLAEFSPDEADLAGAFVENAMSERDALDSADDLVDALSAAGGRDRE
ncbi:MAG: hypothetical protein PHR35_08755 [Kiritimatiellae bacterium]|nr:hypothetical protein [Kiritimatiellia bacterium]